MAFANLSRHNPLAIQSQVWDTREKLAAATEALENIRRKENLDFFKTRFSLLDALLKQKPSGDLQHELYKWFVDVELSFGMQSVIQGGNFLETELKTMIANRDAGNFSFCTALTEVESNLSRHSSDMEIYRRGAINQLVKSVKKLSEMMEDISKGFDFSKN